ncbi:hypothetical protein ABK040_001590 [Willaertia magna]
MKASLDYKSPLQFSSEQIQELFQLFQMYSNQQQQNTSSEVNNNQINEELTISLKDCSTLLRINLGLEITIQEIYDFIQIYSPHLLILLSSTSTQPQSSTTTVVIKENNKNQQQQQKKNIESIPMDFKSFLKFLNKYFIKSNENLNEIYLNEIFQMLDVNSSGTIGKAELCHYFRHILGENILDDQVQDMLTLIGKENVNNNLESGKIKLEINDFKNFVKKFELLKN